MIYIKDIYDIDSIYRDLDDGKLSNILVVIYSDSCYACQKYKHTLSNIDLNIFMVNVKDIQKLNLDNFYEKIVALPTTFIHKDKSSEYWLYTGSITPDVIHKEIES